MKHPLFALLPVGVVLALLWFSSAPAPAQSSGIDFETPSLGTAPNQQIDPYVDTATGTSFTADGNGVIGLVKNSATSACVAPADIDHNVIVFIHHLTHLGAEGWSLQAHRCVARLAEALRRLTDHDLEETVSTRLLVMAARLVASGLPLPVACRSAIVDALTDDHETAAALDDVVQAVLGT